MLEIAFCCIAAFSLTYFVIPSIIRIANAHGLVDEPDDRKSHYVITPSFGGIGIFTGLFLAMLLFCPGAELNVLRYILAALIIVFMVGAVDDLDPISPLAKLSGQLAAVLVLVFLADIRISHLYGLLGLEEISYGMSLMLSCLVYIFLINSFNLIDGINGLSSSIAILCSSILGLWFFMNGQVLFSLIAFAICGSSLAFLKYNITPAKIFMGDTGSLVLGTVTAMLTVRFLEINYAIKGSPFAFDEGISFALGLLILPVFDTCRVFIYRIIKGKSPFAPDKNHIHHLLLDLGLSHMQTTSLLLVINIGFIIMAIRLQYLNPILFITVAFASAYMLTQAVKFSIYLRKRRVVRS